MKKVILNKALTVLLLTVCAAAQAAETAPAAPADAATFAGNTDNSLRYLRLGELALENDDAASAVRFLTQSLPALSNPQLRRTATDLLHESLLRTGQVIPAAALLETALKSDDFAEYAPWLKLMQARQFACNGKSSEAIKLFRELTIQLQPGDWVCYRALESLGRELSRQGDYKNAQKCYADMAAIAGDNALWKFKALEGLIFHALDAGDLAMATQAWEDLAREVPQSLQDTLQLRLQKLKWLLDCHGGKSINVEKDFLKTAAASRMPDPLIARIAYTIAGEATSDYQRAVKYARMAYDYAEGSFRENALLAVIELEIASKMFSEALQDAAKYLKNFPAGSFRHRVLATLGSVHLQLKNDAGAINNFRKLFDDTTAEANLRLSAAESLAALYQKNAQVAEAVAMYEFAIKASAEDAERQGALLQEFGEYLYRLGRSSEALKVLSQAADLQWKGRKNSGYWQVQTLYLLKKYAPAQELLRKLMPGDSIDDTIRMEYLDALLTAELQNVDTAIKQLLGFARKYPKAAQTPDALFQAGALAMRSKKYDAADIFQQFAQIAPGEKAANALYKALGEVLNNNKQEQALLILKKLDEKYPDSKFTIGAHFRWLDHLREQKKFDDAAKTLALIEKRYAAKHPELMPEILYDRAEITRELGDMVNMQTALETLLSKYADQAIAPQAFFMLGDLKVSQGDFAGALAAFQQARERSAGVFRSSCTGRAADAAYALYTQTRQEQYLQQARDGYSTLIKAVDLPPEFRQQSLYKLGRCMENASDSAGALHQYRELLYGALLAKRENRFAPAEWSARALDAALKLLLPAARDAQNNQEAMLLLQEAERLLKIAGELNLSGENIPQQLEAVQRLRQKLN